MATLARIAVHPIKALDPVEPERVAITDVGGLEGDRAYAVVDSEGEYVNGKRTAAVHRLSADVDLDAGTVAIGPRDGEVREFALGSEALDAWLSEYFGMEVSLVRAPGGEQTDGSGSGPTLLSEATLEALAAPFPDIDPDGMGLRLRPNLVVEGVPAFWEDRLIGGEFEIGGVTLEGVKPVPRCVVPTRDPHTGAVTEGFQERFVERREETFPEWADRDDFEHLYAAMIAARIPERERDGVLAVGDELAVPTAT